MMFTKMSGQRSRSLMECKREAICTFKRETERAPPFPFEPKSASKEEGGMSLKAASCGDAMPPCKACGVAKPNLERNLDSERMARELRHRATAEISE
ncbi:hypothetical protein, conserved [Leishmania tarentolae]|uniref:Uncharacterized protein n=1 Tax=Leishmania tarentolae TaxID=5689 RepID=A0A640KT27_LEITA|nr:hypothetical protein, conserved [Leishmania tarentolae]